MSYFFLIKLSYKDNELPYRHEDKLSYFDIDMSEIVTSKYQSNYS
jgi:hypothetical protein